MQGVFDDKLIEDVWCIYGCIHTVHCSTAIISGRNSDIVGGQFIKETIHNILWDTLSLLLQTI